MNRKARKKAKLIANGTYRRSDQFVIDTCRKRVEDAAIGLSACLGITAEDLLNYFKEGKQ